METDEVLASDCPLCGNPMALHSFEGLAAELVEAMKDDE